MVLQGYAGHPGTNPLPGAQLDCKCVMEMAHIIICLIQTPYRSMQLQIYYYLGVRRINQSQEYATRRLTVPTCDSHPVTRNKGLFIRRSVEPTDRGRTLRKLSGGPSVADTKFNRQGMW
jgi:hypothetical protein